MSDTLRNKAELQDTEPIEQNAASPQAGDRPIFPYLNLPLCGGCKVRHPGEQNEGCKIPIIYPGGRVEPGARVFLRERDHKCNCWPNHNPECESKDCGCIECLTGSPFEP